jgi:hypothetical protein
MSQSRLRRCSSFASGVQIVVGGEVCGGEVCGGEVCGGEVCGGADSVQLPLLAARFEPWAGVEGCSGATGLESIASPDMASRTDVVVVVVVDSVEEISEAVLDSGLWSFPTSIAPAANSVMQRTPMTTSVQRGARVTGLFSLSEFIST